MSSSKPASASSILASLAAGVYAVRPSDADGWRGLSQAAGLQWLTVDGSRLRDKDGLIKAVGDALRFPDYFRRNWDAFEECLTDLSWLDEAGVVLMVGPLDALAAKAPKDRDTFMAIARDAAEAAAGTSRPLWVLVVE